MTLAVVTPTIPVTEIIRAPISIVDATNITAGAATIEPAATAAIYATAATTPTA
jgi:hypothetical protein